jgi:hypothetical protein
MLTVRTFAQTLHPGLTPEDATWVAVQDGGGAATWNVLPGNAGVYTFDVRNPDGRYGVAVSCPVTGSVQVIHATLVERTTVDIVCGRAGTATPHDMLVNVTTSGPCGVTVTYPTTTWSTQCGIGNTGQGLSGPHDLIASTTSGLDRVYIARDVDSPSWAVDLFDATRSRASAGRQVLVSGAENAMVFFYTDSSYHLMATGPGSHTYGGFPSDLREPPDVHLIQAGPFIASTRRYLREPADVDFTSLPIVVAPTVTVSRTAADWETYLASGFQIAFGAWSLAVSTGWLDGATDYTYPRLCDEAGFPGTCADVDPATQWTFTGYKPALSFVAPLPAITAAIGSPLLADDGLTFSSAMAFGSF